MSLLQPNRVWIACLLLGVISHGYAQPAAPGSQSPPLPPPPRPITELFRKLLNADSAEQERLLVGRKPEARAVLQAKIAEYKALPTEERERRLQALDVRYYLTSLLALSPATRSNHLAQIPPADRVVVEERLAKWDALPQDLQKKVMQHDAVMAYFVADALPHARKSLPPTPRQEQIESAIANWNALPDQRRTEIANRFDRLMLVPPPEPRMAPVMQRLRDLAPDQRKICLSNFEKFSALSQQDRTRYLENAVRWQQMSLEERQVWSRLIRRMPPLPPGLDPNAGGPPRPPGVATASTE